MTWAAQDAADLVALAEDLELALADALRFHAVEVDSLAGELELGELRRTLEVEALRARLPRWYESPQLHYLLGFLTCALVVDVVLQE